MHLVSQVPLVNLIYPNTLLNIYSYLITYMSRSRIKNAIKELEYYGKIKALRYTGIKGKAWRILTDYVRMRDFIKYGTCISSDKRINHWKDTDGGHYVTMGGHGALVGFSDINVHAQLSSENAWGGMEAGARYRDNLIKRYGNKILDDIELLKNQSVKADNWFFLEKIKEIYLKFKLLKNEHPSYDFPEYVS